MYADNYMTEQEETRRARQTYETQWNVYLEDMNSIYEERERARIVAQSLPTHPLSMAA